jgi:hypothetical protein
MGAAAVVAQPIPLNPQHFGLLTKYSPVAAASTSAAAEESNFIQFGKM